MIVGGGRMGEALLGGLLASGWASAEDLAVVEPVTARRDELAKRFDGVTVSAFAARRARVRRGVLSSAAADVVFSGSLSSM